MGNGSSTAGTDTFSPRARAGPCASHSACSRACSPPKASACSGSTSPGRTRSISPRHIDHLLLSYLHRSQQGMEGMDSFLTPQMKPITTISLSRNPFSLVRLQRRVHGRLRMVYPHAQPRGGARKRGGHRQGKHKPQCSKGHMVLSAETGPYRSRRDRMARWTSRKIPFPHRSSAPFPLVPFRRILACLLPPSQ